MLTSSERGGGAESVKVAYVLSRFPKLTETFVLNEILVVERHGVDVQVYSLLNVREPVMHAEAARLTAAAHYAPYVSRAIAGSQIEFLRANARAYREMVVELVTGLFRSPGMLARTLVLLPIAVHYARLMGQSGIDHIHAHFATHGATAAWVASRLTGIPFSFTVHAHDVYVDHSLLAEKTRDADFVVSISQFNKHLIDEICGDHAAGKVEIIHCGADMSLFRPLPRTGNGGPLSIVCVGALEEKKGQTYLIEACRLLDVEGVPFVCRFVGNGPWRSMLERQVARAGIAGRVIFEGGLKRNLVAEMVGRADVMVLPSIRSRSGMMEGIPVALMEAMACATPVVSTRLSGIPELVNDGVSGLLVKPGDPRALADALARLYREPKLRRDFGCAGRETVLRDFDLETNATALAKLFMRRSIERQVSAGHAPRPSIGVAR